jgi:hypothetical protein
MREKATIYNFANEANMLSWLSVFSQATSVVIRQYGVQRVRRPPAARRPPHPRCRGCCGCSRP